MVDTTQYAEGQFLNPEMVKQSPSKKVYISGDAKVVAGKFGDKLELPIEMDGKQKTWGLARDHVKALQEFGKDSKLWVGKNVNLRVINANGKESILAIPEVVKTEKVQ